MRLLLITQAIDVEDPVLGFFTSWVEEFSRNAENVEVICLKKGKYNLPSNVSVYSLGKEECASLIKYILNFYKYIWRLRGKYDVVFVHMNQEYVILGGLIWHLWNKKIFLWRNHAKGNLFTRLAVMLSDKVFFTSTQSFTARFKKAIQMPVGIDTNFFKPDPLVFKKPNSILFLGRIAAVKKVDEFVEALCALKKLGGTFFATIVGPVLLKDAYYAQKLCDKISENDLGGMVQFTGPVTQEQARNLYRQNALYVNLTPSGSMDKTIFEAMACGSTPLVYNNDLIAVLGDDRIIKNLDALSIAEKMHKLLSGEGRDFRSYVTENHSLALLIRTFIAMKQ